MGIQYYRFNITINIPRCAGPHPHPLWACSGMREHTLFKKLNIFVASEDG